MNYYSQHCLPKDCNKTEPIIIFIDCSVQFLYVSYLHFAVGDTLQRFECLWEASAINWHYMFSNVSCWSQQGCVQVCIVSCWLIFKRTSFFKTWGSCRWPGKATADTWGHQRSWRCELGMTWCWSVPPAHPNPPSTPGIKTWGHFCCCKPVNTRLLLYELLLSLAFHFSPL